MPDETLPQSSNSTTATLPPNTAEVSHTEEYPTEVVNTTTDEVTSTDTPAQVSDASVQPQTEQVAHENTTVADDSTFSFDSFTKLKDGIVNEVSESKAKIKPEVTSTTKTEVESNPEVTVGAKPITSPIRTARDYTGFSDDEKTLLGRTSNDAFAYLRPRLLERNQMAAVLKAKDTEIANLKVGKQVLPDNYYEHPQAFVLSPEYNKVSNDMQVSNYIHNHWKTQLGNIRRGEDWTDLAINNGRPVLTPKQKATPESEAEIMSLVTTTANQLQEFQRKAHTVQVEFSGRAKQAKAHIEAEEKKYFGAFEDEKHPSQPIIKSIIETVPSEFRASPMTRPFAKACAALLVLSERESVSTAKIIELNKKIEELIKQNGGRGRATTPTNNDIAASGSGKGSGKIAGENYDDFKALKNSF